jgi:hypothetical protein
VAFLFGDLRDFFGQFEPVHGWVGGYLKPP